MSITIFVISFFTLFCCYIGYPIIFAVICLLKKGKQYEVRDITPAVSLVTSIHNEDRAVIYNTLENRLNLEYPFGQLKLVFVADSAPYSTLRLIEEQKIVNLKLFAFTDNHGKTGALNKAIPALNTEIIIFSDANTIYAPDAVKKLVRNFSDVKVGAVCGELNYIKSECTDATAKISRKFLEYEKFIKRAESKVSTLTVFNGAIYAIRKDLHREMNPQAANDFQHPMQVILQGYKSVYEPEAMAYEHAVKNDLVEFKRTVRITARGWKGLFSYLAVLNPWQTGIFSVQFIFRKLLRWLSPLFLIIMLWANLILLEQPYFSIVLAGQFSFYFFAFTGWLLKKRGLPKAFYYPYYFCLVNIAALFGFIYFLLRKDTATWVPSTKSV